MKHKSLMDRLYTEPAYYETVRAVGYHGIAYQDLEQKLAALDVSPHLFRAAANQLLMYDGWPAEAKPETQMRLRAEVRRIAHQLLGPEPGSPMYDDYWKGRTPPQPTPEPVKKRPGRASKVKSPEPPAEPRKKKVAKKAAE